jgi:hypothetical protein
MRNLTKYRFMAGTAIAAVGLLSLTAGSVLAGTFNYSSYSVVNEVNVTISPGTGGGLPAGFEYGYFGSGQIDLNGTGLNAGQTLDVWCIDATHILLSSDTYTLVLPSPSFTNNGGVGPTSINHDALGAIGALVQWGDANITANTANSAAVQLAIWEIEYPGATFTSDSSAVIGLVPTLVTDAENQAPGFQWSFNLLEAVDPTNGNQGLVGGGTTIIGRVGTTPLPATWTMMLAGFAGVGFLAYRGRKTRHAAIATA